ncbi:aminopeptidase P family protein [Alteriqipengyuania lutimaris]|uniref:Aminopeptidase P family protein n=1 Tax=Alteriqipengyuania lutimaris TaxID=1538146 RepID=A0A395LN36_9SPHN|nr:aminopeptidase P family protein [Alteriqipengyuania lutimaris]MBB3034155.1 Xaa-Pro aminopeptidase [Alteriqipengyuania lutimaris]RDS76914.1 aminopeptidase P family protein [Alteriqipengyuania lutimaris]
MLMQTHEARLSALREELKKRGLDGFCVPIADAHMSEYVGEDAQRLRWLTGFGGSAGSAAVLQDKAAIFVDGRYTVQVRDQVEERLFEYRSVPKDNPANWLAANASEGAQIGYDAWLATPGWVRTTQKALDKVGAKLVPVEGNPIDAVWADQPAQSDAPARVHSDEHAGANAQEKRAAIADWLTEEKLDAVVLSALDSVGWAFNIRGGDIAHTPVAMAFALVQQDGTAQLFIDEDKVGADLKQHLGNAVSIRPRGEFEGALGQIGGKRIALDPEYGVAGIAQALEACGASVVEVRDPTILPRAIKNQAEIAGHRDAQARDGAALARFLAWIEAEAPSGEIDELTAAAKLLEFRQMDGGLKDTSFDTISAAAGHAALPHYKVDEDSNIAIPPGSIFLCDSGGQYIGETGAGTTDITRTVWVGSADGKAAPTAEMKDRFTRVLKGHIAIAQAIFPEGTTGGQLDTMARQFLWAAGCDYAHGTGHGVGSALGVHEGPQRIAKTTGSQGGTMEPLAGGMICSNEPGYYKAGEFGIRIENLILIEERHIDGADDGTWFGFENLTWVPIDRTLIEPSLLSHEERVWVDEYHARCREILAPQLDGQAADWLERHTKPL